MTRSRAYYLRAVGGLVGLILAATASVVGGTVTLKPAADTTLFELSPDNNLGATVSLPVGTINKGTRCRLLLRFDVAGALPPGAIITAASLGVTVLNSSSVNSNFQLHRVLQPWTEGAQTGSTGAAATGNEATWRYRMSPVAAWSSPGAVAPGDFAEATSASLLLGAPGNYSFASTSNLVTDLRFWLENAAQNYGWVMLSDNETTSGTSKRVASREDTARGPTLTVEFTPPESPPHIDRIVRVGNTVQVQFPVLAGKLYAVEYKTDLGTTGWAALTQVASKFFPTNLVVTNSPLVPPARFYRIGIVGDVD